MVSGGIFDIESKQEKLEKLIIERESPNFWHDKQAAQEVIDQITLLEKPIKTLNDLHNSLEDTSVLNELAEEEHDETTSREVSLNLDTLDKKITDFEFLMMLGSPDDPKNAFLSINSGAGTYSGKYPARYRA